MKVLKLAAAVTASLALITVTAATANAYQLCESDTPGWTACIETQPDSLWHARGWGPAAAYESLWKGTTLQKSAWVPAGGGNITTGGASGSTQACIGKSPTGPFYSCVSHLA